MGTCTGTPSQSFSIYPYYDACGVSKGLSWRLKMRNWKSFSDCVTLVSYCVLFVFFRSKAAVVATEEVVTLGPMAGEGENIFGVAHIFASFNDTFVHVTDISGRETLCRVTGGMKVKADRDEASPYAAMLAAQDVAERLKKIGITAVHIKLRATGGNRTKTPGTISLHV